MAETHQRRIQDLCQYNEESLAERRTGYIPSREPRCRQPAVGPRSTLPVYHVHHESAHSRTWSPSDDICGYGPWCSDAGPGEGCRASFGEPTAAPGTAVRATATDPAFPPAHFSALQHGHYPSRPASYCSNAVGANMIGNPAPACLCNTPNRTFYVVYTPPTCYPLPASQQPPAEPFYRQWPV
jgi:hypothetical protein